MTRKALLIESSQLIDQRDLPGARVDVTNWQSFLTSDEGGAWDSNEIQVISKPTWTALQSVLQLCSKMDYVFMTFSGHGCHVKGKDIDESLISLNEKEDVPVRLINPGNPRCSFVIDTCRQVVTPEAIQEAVAAREMMKSAILRDRQAYREVFDTAVARAEMGIIRMYSCNIGEAAGESAKSGGYYTTFLMRCCIDWHSAAQAGKRSVYSTSSAHDCASIRTSQRNPQQHPQYEGGRRNAHFPLAVKP